MPIPVYVVTGFLDSGKTTFLNDLLNRHDRQKAQLLVIQFEAGEEAFLSQNQNCQSLSFLKKALERQPEQIVDQIGSLLQDCNFDEIWIEWNGVVPLSQLQAFLHHPSLRGLCVIQQVLHVVDAATIENLLGRTGSPLLEQIANCDFIVLRNIRSPAAFRRIKRLMREINPGVDIYENTAYSDLRDHLLCRKENPITMFLLILITIVAMHIFIKPVLEAFQIPINTMINIFLGIILQAFPFLLIGVLLSSAIQVFIPQSAIERRFPKSLGLGMLVAVLGGFCLPVCDCASIPVFRSLVRKGVPLPAAITFMVATPIINPVVILSTYYAFGGDLTIVAARVCFGIIAAVLIGLSFAVLPPKGQVVSGGGANRIMCSCGFYDDMESVISFRGKIGLFLRHSKAEFFSVGKYLIISTFISAVFQTVGTGIFTPGQSGAGLAVSIVIMMAMAFILSLCSSSDAVIARSFSSQFPMGAVMGFLVFGPMMDLKNLLMLSSGFSKRFIIRLLFTVFAVCFSVVFLFFALGGM